MISGWKVIIFYIWVILILLISLKVTSFFVDKLFTYHDYERYRKRKRISKRRIFMKRIWRIFNVYLFLGTSLGLIIYFLGIVYPPSRVISGEGMLLALSSFVMSFSVIIIFRLIVLVDKKKIGDFFEMELIKIFNKNFPYKKQREYVESLLFSVIFLAMLGSLVYLGVNILSNGGEEIVKTFTLKFPSVFSMFSGVFVFLLVVFLATFAVEMILLYLGVHKNYVSEYV